jgi:hypothetical protein
VFAADVSRSSGKAIANPPNKCRGPCARATLPDNITDDNNTAGDVKHDMRLIDLLTPLFRQLSTDIHSMIPETNL